MQTEEDTLAEAAETFTLSLTLVSPDDGSVELGTDRATATIADDDVLQASVTRQHTTVLEGANATFVVDLTRQAGGSASGSRPVVVSYGIAAASTATAADYNMPSGKLTIPAGQSSGTITIQTTSDDILELGGETVAVQLTALTTAAGSVVQPDGTSALTTIRDAGGTVVVSVADAAPVDEGDAATFRVTLSGKVSQPVVVTASLVALVQAQNQNDFEDAAPASLTIPAGETTGTFTVQTTDDDDARVAEADEKFTLTIAKTSPADTSGVVLGAATATGTIRDNDPLRVNLTGLRAAAGSSAEFTAELTGGTGSSAITVEYSYTINGTSDADKSGRLRWVSLVRTSRSRSPTPRPRATG